MLAVLLTAALIAVGCSGVRGELVESGITADGENDAVELSFVSEAEAEAMLFDFSASELFTGSSVDGQELLQNAPLIVTFVVPSCPVCVAEAPKLGAAAEANAHVNFVVVHSFGELEDFRSYTNTTDLSQENILHIVDTDGVLWERFGIISQPSSVLIDGQGRVTNSRGALGDDGLLRAVATVSD